MKDSGYATNIGELEFLARVQSSDGFWKSVNCLSKKTGMEVDELESFARNICQSVWTEVDAVLASEGPVAAAREETDRLKRKLVACNLSAMKQMLASKAGSHFDANLGDDTITFHEPMQYLDTETKDLVMNIVCDKMRQLEHSTAPPSLVQALVNHAQAQSNSESASMEDLKEARAQLADAQNELRKARIRMEEAEELSRKFEERLRVAEDRAQMLEQELSETKVKLKETEDSLGALRAEHVALMDAHKKLQELSEQQQAKIERQGRELENERRINAELRAEVERLQEYVHRAEQLERELNALQARFDKLEAEANCMREELARRNNTRTKGTQTALTGSKLDEQSAETQKLKLMLEELQNKLKELMTEYRRKFGDAATKIADGLGLKELLKEETVFQRLYDDALDRVHRLEQLRAKVRKEKGLVGEPPYTEVPILQAVEESQPTPAIRELVREKTGYDPSPQPPISTWASRPQHHDQGCGDDVVSDDAWKKPHGTNPPVMKPSMSLPSLRKADQHVSMINLNLGKARRTSKRSDIF
jgi:myosin heavy subunit